MAFVEVSVQRTNQPQDLCRADTSVNPAALWNFASTSDAVSGAASVYSASTPKVSSSYGVGRKINLNVTNAYECVSPSSAVNIGAGDFTVICTFTLDANGGYSVIGRWNTGGTPSTSDWILGSGDALGIGNVSFSVACGSTVYAASVTSGIATGIVNTLIGRRRGTTIYIDRYVNGIREVGSSTTNAGITTVNYNSARKTKIGEIDAGSNYNARITAYSASTYKRYLSDDECSDIAQNVWVQYAPEEQWIWVPDAAGSPTNPSGDLAATESGSDTASLSGQIVVQGALAVTETGTDTSEIQGGASPITGSLSATESGTDTSAISGGVAIAGTLAAAESGADTAEIQGGASPITGSLSATESGADTSAIQGGVVVAGTLAATESGTDTASIAAQLIVQGALAATEAGNDSALINGSSVIITTGTISATESGADGCVSTGTLLVQGLLDAAESGTDTVYAPGQIYVIGALVATETGSDTCAIAGSSPVTITGMLDAVEIGADTCQILQSAITAVYPQPDQVLSGIPYGPTGADYTGTATAGSYPTAADIAAAVWSYTQ